jgi:transposase, IS30 family
MLAPAPRSAAVRAPTLPGCDVAAVRRVACRAPRSLFRPVVSGAALWDQGKEMAEHARFSVESGVRVHFCDPNSPWQRGRNENSNGLLRKYFPRRASLAGISQEQLDAVAARLNGRPRKTLGWVTPAERFAELVAPGRG